MVKKLMITVIVLLNIVVLMSTTMFKRQKEEISLLEERVYNETYRHKFLEAQLREIDENQKGKTRSSWDAPKLIRWLKAPSLKDFNEVSHELEKYMTRDELFKWLMESYFYEKYLFYVSGKGVRGYKASLVRREIFDLNHDEWWWKSTYRLDPKQSVPEVQIPSELMKAQDEMEDLLSTMEEVFPLKN